MGIALYFYSSVWIVHSEARASGQVLLQKKAEESGGPMSQREAASSQLPLMVTMLKSDLVAMRFFYLSMEARNLTFQSNHPSFKSSKTFLNIL